ncbi:hypothetical protein ACFY4C_41390 [Actinomadura viridis]|uniref:hypothetical protein n=1 Tax=Actinomadura viridis TaxID=58110 RepID=UPI003679C523
MTALTVLLTLAVVAGWVCLSPARSVAVAVALAFAYPAPAAAITVVMSVALIAVATAVVVRSLRESGGRLVIVTRPAPAGAAV